MIFLFNKAKRKIGTFNSTKEIAEFLSKEEVSAKESEVVNALYKGQPIKGEYYVSKTNRIAPLTSICEHFSAGGIRYY